MKKKFKLKRLKKDIVIKAGTIFDCVDGTISKYYNDNYSKLFSLTADTYGEIIYSLDKEDKALDEWFEDIEENKMNYKEYDSTLDTTEHINRVRNLLDDFIDEIIYRAECHDESKLISPEKEVFDKVTPRLKTLTYNSEEYKESLKEMGSALEHHYNFNRHHPEHYPNGISDMTLIDILEMLCDWKAATERHTDGDIYTSLKINKERFNISDQLFSILLNTVERIFEK